MTGNIASPIRWKRKSIDGRRSQVVRGWVMLVADQTSGITRLAVGNSDADPQLLLRKNGFGTNFCVAHIPEKGAVISIPTARGLGENGGVIRVVEIGWMQAYPLLFWQVTCGILGSGDVGFQAFRVAIALLVRFRFGEFRRRLVRRGGGGDMVRSPETGTTIRRTARRHKSTSGAIRTVMCSHSLDRDGAPISQFELTVKLVRDGVINPVVVSPRDGPLRNEYEAEGISVVIKSSGIEHALTVREYDRVIADYAEFLESMSPDLVYANTSQTFFAIEAANQRRLPCVWNIRESEAKQVRFETYSLEIQNRAFACLGLADWIVFVAQATEDVWLPFPAGVETAVIHNSLDPSRMVAAERSWTRDSARRSLELEPDEISIVCVGTICERKGQCDIPRAVKHLPETLWPNLRVDLIGATDGEYGHDLAREIEELPLALRNRVNLCGSTEDVARHILGADIFICASRRESYPRVILEAMAGGIAIISTPVFGIREQLSDGETGLFYEPGDTDCLAKQIDLLMRNSEKRRLLGVRAREMFGERDDFDAMALRYADLFWSACS